jgi:hypothetical protein
LIPTLKTPNAARRGSFPRQRESRTQELHSFKQHLADVNVLMRLRGQNGIGIEPKEVHYHLRACGLLRQVLIGAR